MYYNILKSVKYREQYYNNIKRKWFLNMCLKNHFLFFNLYKYNQIKNNISICKIRTRCFINGRSRSVFSKSRLSRFFFKEFARKGLLNGIMKF